MLLSHVALKSASESEANIRDAFFIEITNIFFAFDSCFHLTTTIKEKKHRQWQARFIPTRKRDATIQN